MNGFKKGQISWHKGQHKIKPLYEIYHCTICGKPLTDRQVSVLLCKDKWNGKHPDAWGCSKECGQIIAAKKRIGHSTSEETKIKIGDSQRGEKNHAYGKPSWNKGIPMRLESRAKLKINAHVMYGDNHPNWKGGISFESYGKGWKGQIRSEIRDRDLHQCQLCGKFENGRHYDIHHIDYDKKNLDPMNLITLCNSCHMKTGFNREKWIAVFKALQKDKEKVQASVKTEESEARVIILVRTPSI